MSKPLNICDLSFTGIKATMWGILISASIKGGVSVWQWMIQHAANGGGQIIFDDRFHDEFLNTHF